MDLDDGDYYDDDNKDDNVDDNDDNGDDDDDDASADAQAREVEVQAGPSPVVKRSARVLDYQDIPATGFSCQQQVDKQGSCGFLWLIAYDLLHN